MRLVILIVAALVAGCASPAPRVTYVSVPAGYTEKCELPVVPDDNTGLADAFVQAYKCAEIGNRDKERIIQWQEQIESRLH